MRVGSSPTSRTNILEIKVTLKVKDAIAKLQLLHPELEILSEADDGGLPFGVSDIVQSTWENDDGTLSPVALVQIFC